MIIEVAALVGIAGLVAIGCIGVLSWGDRRPIKAENAPRRGGHWAAWWRRSEKPEGNESPGAANVVHGELQGKAHPIPRAFPHRQPTSGARTSSRSTSAR